ncbi:MAG: hypothetical protein ABFD62_05030 [Syntrophaceae bacterium]
MRNDTGESSSSITNRSDNMAWSFIVGQLKEGATLLRIPKFRKSYPDKGQGPYGQGISDTRVRELERNGILQKVGVDRYVLNKDRS